MYHFGGAWQVVNIEVTDANGNIKVVPKILAKSKPIEKEISEAEVEAIKKYVESNNPSLEELEKHK